MYKFSSLIKYLPPAGEYQATEKVCKVQCNPVKARRFFKAYKTFILYRERRIDFFIVL